MRELKFRAWYKEKNEMREVAMLRWENGRLMRIAGYWPGTRDNGWTDHDPLEGRYELMQFTGLLDNADNEIYESDILVVFDEDVAPVTDDGAGPMEVCNHIVRVEMRDGEWGVEIPKLDDGETGWHSLHRWKKDISNDGYEVAGNIHQNPELI